MNKKFLSAILFGALMVTSTGTFVSCKDYDDDIENLQSQINNLATKSDVEAKLAQLQSALNAAQAESSANAADIAALEKEVASMQAKIQAAVEADMAKYKADIEALIKKVEGVVGEIADYVTSVELISSYTKTDAEWPLALDFFTITEKANVFEENIAGAIEFEKGKQTQVAVESILVRVSPTNAVLTPEMISLVNSKGENLDTYVDVAVTPYTKLMTVASPNAELKARAAENNGLWEIKVTLKEWNEEQFNSLKATEDGTILYAVQVNNALSAAETRYVTSTYDVTLGDHANFQAASNLLFTVDGTSVEEINNRFTNASLSLKEQGKAEMYAELDWAKSTTDYPTPAVAIDKDKKNVTEADDDRSKEALALAVQGTPLTIAIDEEIKDQVKALYVTLDKANAVESAPSELNAWNSYEYTGLNKVVEGTSTTITINGKETINDIIGFRVYAVNYDGTLVDPDGKAFYVLVGDKAADWNVVATTIVPDADKNTLPHTEKSAAVAVETSKLTAPYKWSWFVDKDNKPFSIALVDKDGKLMKAGAVDAIFHHDTSWKGDVAAGFKFEDVKAIYTIPAKDSKWTDYEDDKTYTGTFTVTNVDGFVLASVRVSMTKVLPTSIPEGLTIKTNQVENGIYNCYMIPMANETTESWTANSAKFGSMAMNQIFNFEEDVVPAQTEISFATSKKDKDGEYTEAKTVTGADAIVVDAKLIDNATKHATSVVYNYGEISSKKVDGKFVDYKVAADEFAFETIYNCIYNDTYTWSWATREQLTYWGKEFWTAKDAEGNYVNAVPELTLTYGTAFSLTEIDKYIYGASAWDSKYNMFLNPSYEGSLFIVSATFTSDANGKQEYFEPVVDKTAGRLNSLSVLPETSNPVADVASTLTIKVKDMYGHDRVITIPAVVKPRKTEAAE